MLNAIIIIVNRNIPITNAIATIIKGIFFICSNTRDTFPDALIIPMAKLILLNNFITTKRYTPISPIKPMKE